jgi:hypothetical protein
LEKKNVVNSYRMGPGDAIHIKGTVARYYPLEMHKGIILEAAPFSTIYSTRQWRVLWSDGTVGEYPVRIIEMGWSKI